MRPHLQILIILVILAGSRPALAWDMDDISIHGFASTGYLRSDKNNYLLNSEDGSFEFNEVAINFGTELTQDMRVGIQLYSFDLGDIGNNEVKLDWASVDYEWREWMGVRAGKIKGPYGLYSEIQDYDMLRTAILLPQGIYTLYQREAFASIQGASLYGKIPLSSAGKIAYALYGGTTTMEKDGGLSKIYTRNGLQFESGRVEYLAGLRLFCLTPLRGLKLGGNYFYLSMKYNGTIDLDIPAGSVTVKIPVDMDFATDNSYAYLLSVEYDYGRLTLAAEYRYIDFDTNIIMDLSNLGGSRLPAMRRSFHIRACYGLISYRVFSWLKVGTYYSFYEEEQDQQSDDLTSRQKDLAFSTRFDINAAWLVKLEAHYMDGVGLLTEPDNPEGLGSLDKYWMLYAIKTTFNF